MTTVAMYLGEGTAFTAKRGSDGPSGPSGSFGSAPLAHICEAAASPLRAALIALERRRPEHMDPAAWQRAVEDGLRFVVTWGPRAERLGWTAADVFGLPPVPANPHPGWQRRSRVDLLGLVWLTRGRPVTAITADTATIATSNGGALTFRRRRAPGRSGGLHDR